MSAADFVSSPSWIWLAINSKANNRKRTDRIKEKDIYIEAIQMKPGQDIGVIALERESYTQTCF